jgi:uncharacterized alkaline shock family protein YloU
MGILLRIVLFIFSITAAIIGVVALLFGLKIVSQAYFSYWVEQLYLQNDLRLIVIVVGALLIVGGIYLFYRSLYIKKKDKTVKYFATETEAGQVRVSVDAIEGIALNAIKSVSGIKEPKVKAKLDENNQALIKLSALVNGNRPIPDLSAELQYAIKEEVEQIVGIPLANIEIAISDLATSHR